VLHAPNDGIATPAACVRCSADRVLLAKRPYSMKKLAISATMISTRAAPKE
jgi:hypothetical protein